MLGRIALDLTRDANLAGRIQAAIQLAERHEAELIGVCTTPPTPQYMYNERGVPEQVLSVLLDRIADEIIETKQFFLKVAADCGIKAQCRVPKGSIEEVLALQARFCDLLIMSQTDNAESLWTVPPSVAESVITSAGRPVLMIPYTEKGQHFIGRRVLFCWDYGRRAARAGRRRSDSLSGFGANHPYRRPPT